MLPAVRNTALMRGKTYIGIDFGTSTTVVSIVSYDEYDHKIHTKSLRLPQMLPDGTLYRSEIVPTVLPACLRLMLFTISWVNTSM